MDTGERLAAYLSGDLDIDERTAVEAELADDPALRARLERIRAADTALADLPDVELPEGFSARLRERVAPEVDAVVGDQLAARRARRAAPAWLPALGAAAVLAVVVAGGITLGGGMGGQDTTMDTAIEDDGARTMMGDEEAGGADTQMLEDTDLESADQVTGPIVTHRGRTLALDDLQQLATDPEVQAALESGAVQVDPLSTADAYADALREALPRAQAEQETDSGDAGAAAEQDDAVDSNAANRAPHPDVMRQDGVSDEDLEAVARCVPVLSEGAAAPVVPLYVELATDEDGDEVIVYVALAQNADEEYRRVEVWMVSRDDCEPRQFIQSDT